MRIWPALLLAPLAALFAISAGYAVVPAACSSGQEWLLHTAFLAPLAFSITVTLLAATRIPAEKEPYLPRVATWTGALFSLVIAVAWATSLVLPPCRS